MRVSLDASLSLTQLAASYGGLVISPDVDFTVVSTDSRKIIAGDIFVALKGESMDGHDYCRQAVGKGASALVVDRYIPNLQSDLKIVQWVVKDTTLALGQIAKSYRALFSLPVIALTGSSGKTTVKEMIRSILRVEFGDGYSDCSVITSNNYNNEIGVPFTLMQLNHNSKIAVLEMGARHVGDIKLLCDWANPTISLVNNTGTAHLGEFGSVQNIVDAKGEIYSGSELLETAVMNFDSDGYKQYREQTAHLHQIIFGDEEKSDIKATDIKESASGLSFKLHLFNNSLDVTINAMGSHNVSNAMAAAACAWSAGVSSESIVSGLSQFMPSQGRLMPIAIDGVCKVIDDTYNANPDSVKSAIDVLALQSNKKILVLGSMGELGEQSFNKHKHVLAYANQKLKGDFTIMLTGDAWKNIELMHSHVLWYPDKEELAEALQEAITPKSTVLVKGSRFMLMETVIDQLKQKSKGQLSIQPVRKEVS